MASINLGPLALPVGPVLLMASYFGAVAIARWAGRKQKVDVEPLLWKILLVAVVTARAAFVALYFDAYQGSPLKMLDIRDGGFIATAGFLAAAVMTIWFGRRQWEGRRPFLVSAVAWGMLWIIGAIATMAIDTRPGNMPQVSLTRLDGKPVDLKSFRGKPVVVNLWATWCPPCRREMPVLRDAQQHNKDVVFVFANQGESGATVNQYLNGENLGLENVLLDRDQLLGKETGSRALPTTLFLNARGEIVDRRMGELSEATLTQRLDSLRLAR